jgi:ABC-type multidrug transport system permease subunit
MAQKFKKVLLYLAICFRVFIVLNFIVSCYAMVIKYNPTNIDVQCVYIVFLVFAFLLMTLCIKKLKKGE